MDPNACLRDMLDYIRAGELIEAHNSLRDLKEWVLKGGAAPDFGAVAEQWFERNLKCDKCGGKLVFTQTSDWTRRPGMAWCGECKRVIE